jgi:hypothetical protein
MAENDAAAGAADVTAAENFAAVRTDIVALKTDLEALEDRVAKLEQAPKAASGSNGTAVGGIVTYTGDESNGGTSHPAMVTGVDDKGNANLIVFFDGSPPGVRKGVARKNDHGDQTSYWSAG